MTNTPDPDALAERIADAPTYTTFDAIDADEIGQPTVVLSVKPSERDLIVRALRDYKAPPDLRDEVSSFKQHIFETLRDQPLLIALQNDDGTFTVHQWLRDGVAPSRDYPTSRLAASRLLQLLGIGPVAPQSHPETVGIGVIATETPARPGAEAVTDRGLCMTTYDSTVDTLTHIRRVQALLGKLARDLMRRGEVHDASKLGPKEKPLFDEMTPLLKTLTYGTDEYKASLARLGTALKHHYAANSHHPEHYGDGIGGMTLLDLVEMLCDWRAASERTKDGDIRKSIEIGIERFKIEPQLASILRNSIASASTLPEGQETER